MLFGNFCSTYNPAVYTGYDILQPNEDVQKNPLSVIEVAEDGEVEILLDTEIGPGVYFIVAEAFMMWVFELKNEVLKLRKKGKG